MNKNEYKVKHLIFVTISMAGGGTERVISTLANYYIKNGINVTIVMIAGNEIAYELDAQIVVKQISEQTNGSFLGRINRIASLKEVFKDNKDALVIGMGTVASMFTCISSLFQKNKVVISERNDPNRLNHRPIKWYERIVRNILYYRANKIVFQTRLAQDQFPNYIVKRSVIIGNPIEERKHLGLSSYKREKVILAAGRLTEQKNFSLLIDAFGEFHREHTDYKLYIFGEGEQREKLQKQIEEEELLGCVELKGFSKYLDEEMRRAEVYVSTSNWEGISNTLAEAMVNGMAVIATDCPMGGSATLIKNDYNGKLIPVNNKELLLEAMESIVKDIYLKNRICDNACKVIEELSVERIALQWISLV